MLSRAKRVGPYKLTEEVGKGAYSTVLKGVNSENGDLVAVKMIRRKKLTPKLHEGLEKEISIMAKIRNPNIISLKDIQKTDNNFYLILEFCDGGDLSKYIKAHGHLSEGRSKVFLRHLLNGLIELKKRGILHRDLKLANLLLKTDPDGNEIVKIGDFGFARELPKEGLAETFCGTPLNMAPEVMEGHAYNEKADMWSVGTILYEMLVGKPPFQGENLIHLHKVIKTTPWTVPKHTTLSEEAIDLLTGLLQVDPKQRVGLDHVIRHPFCQFTPEAVLSMSQFDRKLSEENKEASDEQSDNVGSSSPHKKTHDRHFQHRLSFDEGKHSSRNIIGTTIESPKDESPSSSDRKMSASSGQDRHKSNRERAHTYNFEQDYFDTITNKKSKEPGAAEAGADKSQGLGEDFVLIEDEFNEDSHCGDATTDANSSFRTKIRQSIDKYLTEKIATAKQCLSFMLQLRSLEVLAQRVSDSSEKAQVLLYAYMRILELLKGAYLALFGPAPAEFSDSADLFYDKLKEALSDENKDLNQEMTAAIAEVTNKTKELRSNVEFSRLKKPDVVVHEYVTTLGKTGAQIEYLDTSTTDPLSYYRLACKILEMSCDLEQNQDQDSSFIVVGFAEEDNEIMKDHYNAIKERIDMIQKGQDSNIDGEAEDPSQISV